MSRKSGLRIETDKTISDKSYPFIPHTFLDIYYVLERIEKYFYDKNLGHPPTFLDAGCGVGNIMLIADAVGFEASGIDLNPDLIEMAHHLLHNIHPEPVLDIADILSYNKYNTFDVIYYFHPLRNGDMERVFEKKVEKEAKVGAIIIAAMKRDRTIFVDKRFRRLDPLEGKPSDIRVFQKVRKRV